MNAQRKTTDDFSHERWNGIVRSYNEADVLRLRGSVRIDYTLAHLGAERLWKLLHSEDYVNALGVGFFLLGICILRLA